ncbi:MAG: PRC-barrel domain-containing protein [Actinomycetota bacterium]|nr:PRC-barrel domain-containing protein [Actinomycetota bacterium]
MDESDRGAPIAYLALEEGTSVYTSDGARVGTVEHVLADANVDIFDGVIVDSRLGPGGDFHFADAEQIGSLFEHAVILRVDAAGFEALPEPSENAAVMRADPDDVVPDTAGDRLRRAWDYLSGRY